MAIHSIVQELVMTKGLTEEIAQQRLDEMCDRVQTDGDLATDVLEDHGLDGHGAWIRELEGDD